MDVSNAVNPSEPFGPKGVRQFRTPGILSISPKVIQRRIGFGDSQASELSFQSRKPPKNSRTSVGENINASYNAEKMQPRRNQGSRLLIGEIGVAISY